MDTRAHRLLIAKIVLALMLFSQGVMAWSACDWLESSPDRAVRAAAAVAPCHESGFGGACLTHCLADRQNVQKAAMDVPALLSVPVLTLALQFDPVRFTGIARVCETAAGTGPPRRLLLHSFQI